LKLEDDIKPRQLRFSLSKTAPRYWNDGCAVMTHLFSSMAIISPAFERLAITSVLPFRIHVQNGQNTILAKQLQGFIEQESAHGSEFIRYNQILKSQGYDIKKLEKASLGKIRWLANKLSLKMHLSLTLAAEHITAIISDLLLREKSWLENALPSYAGLWRWHAIEEIEHKAVAYDLYQSMKGGYWSRILGMYLLTQMLVYLLSRNFFHLAHRDKLLFTFAFWRKSFHVFWGRLGFLRKLILPYLRYYLPTFHPWQQDNHALIVKWKEQFIKASSFDEIVNVLQGHYKSKSIKGENI